MTLNLAEVGKQGDQTQGSFLPGGCLAAVTLGPTTRGSDSRSSQSWHAGLTAGIWEAAVRGGQRLTEPVLDRLARPEPVREPPVGVSQRS